MNTKNTIILYKIEDVISLYVNGYKQGYHNLIIFNPMYGKDKVTLTKPDITISGLPAGHYYIYCQNESGEETGDIQIDISYETQTEYLNNILLNHDCFSSPYTEIVKSLKSDDYIPELYKSYKHTTETKELYEYLLSILSNEYNAKQEKLNLFVNPLFKFNTDTNSIISFYDLPYTFYVYRYDLTTDTWIFERDLAQYNVSQFTLDGKPSELYRISVLSDFQIERIYYLYQPPKSLSETILERKILANKLIAEKTAEFLLKEDSNNIKINDQHKLAASLLEFDILQPVFQRPVIETDDEKYIVISIKDYSSTIFQKYPFYIAALETTELFTGAKSHKTKITAATMRILKSDLLINTDTEYVFYIINELGQKMSQVTFVSFDKEYPAETYFNYYRKIQLDRYIRKLYVLFRQYDINDWESISSIVDRYFFSTEQVLSFRDFIIQQLTYLNPNQYRIDLMIQIVLLCDLQYYMPINQDFIKNQVYSHIFKTHILPADTNQYIIRIASINNNIITYDYKLSYNAGTEIRTDKNDFVFIQCIDPSSWNMSSIAFYNNYVKNGQSAFYFPKMEVETI